MAAENDNGWHTRCTCCPGGHADGAAGVSRRTFLQGVGGATLVGAAITGLSWSALAAADVAAKPTPKRRALKVKPVLVYSTPQPRPQTSWRNWGGIQTEDDAKAEIARIQSELGELKARAEFPLDVLAVAAVKSESDVPKMQDLNEADVFIVYAAGGPQRAFDLLAKAGKDMIFFCRHKSGPVYLWYEIISPRYLRQHTDALRLEGVDDGDVVVDSQDEILWRLRALCGLRNAMGTRIIAIGGPGAWAQPADVVPNLVRKIWKFDIQTVSYEELGNVIKDARADQAAVAAAKSRAKAYVKPSRVKLETDMPYVENAFLLEDVFHRVLKKADCTAITINGCMGTIMPLAETSACLTLSLLNDSGYLAFCESDFVVIPAGVLLANISGRPVFLNDPTYPHDGLITLAHCTAPRKMDGKKADPVRILTHFESDYGAAPKVEMRKGQVVTNIVPDFAAKRWVGVRGKIADAPFMDICRSQIDVSFDCCSKTLAERMPGFHWMTCYGDYVNEVGYALKKVGITWENLTA